MANVKISQLPEYTGNTTGTWLVMNNSGETTTYKVLLSNVLQSGTSGTSGTSGSSGTSGAVGATGSSGSSGTSGVNGSSGSSGTSGSSGSSGDSLFAQTGSFWNTTNNIGITGSLYVTSIYNKLDANNGTNILTGSINAMDASGYGNYIIAKPSTGLNIINASENLISSSIKTTLTGPTKIVGNTTLTGSLYVSSSQPNVHNSLVVNKTNGNNWLEAAGNSLLSYGGTGHFTPGNEIIAYNGGYNTLSGSNNILLGGATITGSLNVTGSFHRIIGDVEITGSNPGLSAARSLKVSGSVAIGRSLFVGTDNAIVGGILAIGRDAFVNISGSGTGTVNSTAQSGSSAVERFSMFASASYGAGLSKDSSTFLLIESGSNQPLKLLRNTNITGSLNVSSSISPNVIQSINTYNAIVASGSIGLNILNAAVNDITSSVYTRFTGPIQTTGSLNVNGNTTISGSLTISGSNSSTNILVVSGSGRFNRNLTIGNNLSDPLLILTSTGSATIDVNSGKDGTIILETMPTGGPNTSYFGISAISGSGTKFYDLDLTSIVTSSFLEIPKSDGSFSVPQMKRGLVVTGSLNVTSKINLTQQSPLPSGVVGDIASSGSLLYFHNGSTWKQISLL